eukprot:2424869-Heterocapsa_arctica.AAC.1
MNTSSVRQRSHGRRSGGSITNREASSSSKDWLSRTWGRTSGRRPRHTGSPIPSRPAQPRGEGSTTASRKERAVGPRTWRKRSGSSRKRPRGAASRSGWGRPPEPM